ncbi:hypothetical protein LOK49_LG05G02026 [Camellia lanceoleosa]|uniref:Uncharacterized protein n=1 Tax=Camellia lanceoleosa TaxID=1840588 RepID=A0ACC0HHY5_9ERIC|nr:hypothetical protein LOK49_LG05G02026 [Camellia lanceoleosa]
MSWFGLHLEASRNEIKKKEKKDKLEVIGAPKKTEKYLMKKKKIKDDSSDNSSSSDSEDDDYNKRKVRAVFPVVRYRE